MELNEGKGWILCFVFIVNSIDGVSRVGVFGLLEIFVNGLLLIIVYIFVINVVSILCVMFFCWWLSNMVFKIFFEILMSFFYVFFMCGVWGGLNFYIIWEFDRNLEIGLFLMNFVFMERLFIVLMKFVFLLEWNCVIWLWIVIKCFNVFMNVVLVSLLMILIWIVWVIR